MHQPHQSVHPLQQPHSHLHTLNHQQQPPPPQHHPYLHPPPPSSSLQQSQQPLSAQQSASMHLSPSMHPPLQSQQQPHHHQLQQLPHPQQHHHLSHLNHPHSNQQLQHLSGQSQSSHGLSQQRQQQPQHHQHQSQAQQQHQIPPPPTHHHMTHPSALMNPSQYPNLMYAQMGSHGYVPSTGHVPSPFSHPSSSSHRSEAVGANSQQQSTQQSGSINSGTTSHMGQIAPSSNTTPGASGVHQTPGSAMDTHMQSRLPLNQPYMMTNPYMHNAFYNQTGGAGSTSSGYYGYDQSYGQVAPDPYSHAASNSAPHWPSTAPPSSMMNSSNASGAMQPQLRAPIGAGVPTQAASAALPPPAPRVPLSSRTPERSPAPSMASSYPSPNHQSSSKTGSNSLAQLEQMVMPGSGQAATPLKSPNHRSTTSSPNTNALQPQQSMQYSYNSGGQGSYFSPTAHPNQSSYYPPYESPESLDPAKSSWSDQASVMIPPTAGPSLDSSAGPYNQSQSYDGPSTYGDYTQLSTPSQSRFTTSSDMPTEQPQADKSDPYAIDSQTFEDHDDQSATTKTKKSRAKKGEDSTKKEKRQRAPRGAKAAAAAAASAASASAAANATVTPVQGAQSPAISTNVPVALASDKTPLNSMPQTPEVPHVMTDPIDQTALPVKPTPTPIDESPEKNNLFINQDLQPLMPRPRTASQSSRDPVVQSGYPKSPSQNAANESSNVSATQPPHYPYSTMGAESYGYNHDSRAAPAGYYPPYVAANNTGSQQTSEPGWASQPAQPLMPIQQTSSVPPGDVVPTYNSDYNESMGYNQYTQLSTPSQSKPAAPEAVAQVEPSQADKSEQNLTEPQGTIEPETTPVGKPKRSRAKKPDDQSKRERKSRASKTAKVSTPAGQSVSPSGDSTIHNDLPTATKEEASEHAESDLTQVRAQVDQDETLVSNEKPEDSKPKKSRPKRERKPKSTPKPPPTQQADESSQLPVLEQLDVVPSTTNELIQDDTQVSAPEETSPVKPKRIRIRDSSSKGKKKLPKFALKFAKTKKRKRLGSSDNEQSDLDKTPPPSPDEAESGVQKRRSARNTKKLKYNDDDIGIGFSDSDDDDQPQPRKKSSTKTMTETGETVLESVVAEEPTVFAAPVEDTMVVEKIMSSRTGTRELEPEPGEVLPPDGTFIDVEEFYVKYKNMSYLHCDWRTLEELERGDRRVAQKVKRFKQKKDSSNVFNFMDDDIFDPQYCEVDRILAVNEVEELVPESEDDSDDKKVAEAAQSNTDISAEAKLNGATSIDACENKDSKQDPDPNEKMDVDATLEAAKESSGCEPGHELEKMEIAEQSLEDKAEAVESAELSVQPTAPDEPIEDKSVIAIVNIASDENAEVKPKKMKKKISKHYLVKWRALSYEDSTWELEEHLDSEKIKQFERFKDPPPKSKWRPVKRPKPDEWVRKEASPVYKNNNTLREYQLEGINWLSFCWHQGRNCILADEMGLGKTIQSIAFINEIYQKGIYGPFLIIVPLSTVGNWAREFETWTDLNVITYHGSSTSREMLKEYEMFYRNEQGNRITSVYKFQVMITTFEIVLSDCLDLREIPWRCCIIDEAHRLKNRNCKLLEGLRLLNMEHRVLLTGTPLQNNVEELFSLLNFLEPTQFSSTEQFLLEFGDLKTEAQVDKLKLILKPMMLRRLKEDVEKTLAPKEETIVEVELTNIQKKYYRAILERNFSFLQKGSTNNNMPNLMNTMMELRKCCIHPYLINGAEEQILYEARQTKLAGGEPMSSHQAMVNASGKLVLIDKLLPRLKADGHRVLIFSQMVRCLDILEDYVTNKHYPYERIDGRVRGSDRQQAIDRYSKPGSDRFVFLLCTRAGGLGINLTAADTVIIFDSDWNPQNDLQAQARCHRIGQSKAVKIYRLICRNTYEREMFDKASLKLGLDKAVLQSMNTQKGAAGCDGQLTKKEIEELLRKGAYGALMDDDNAGDKFCEEDIDQILQRRTQVITIESAEAKGSTFSKATFSSSNNREDIELDDPNFWEKWAKKANIEAEDLLDKDDLIQLAPRRRTQTKRYGADGTLIEMSDLESSEEDEETISMRTRGSRRGQSKPTPSSASKRSKRNRLFEYDDDEYMANIDGGYWSKSDCLKIENGLLTYGWGRWDEIVKNNHFKREINAEDCENISRVILLYCLNSYKGDEKIKSFVWELIVPPEEASKSESEAGEKVATRGRKPKFAPPVSKRTVAEEIMDANWPKDAKNDPLIALPDDQYRRHLQRNCNRLLIRVKFLHYLKFEIFRDYQSKIFEPNCNANSIDLPPFAVDGDLPALWWDDEADKSLLIGIYKHGHDRFNKMRQDPNLCFLERCGPPSTADLNAELNIRSVCVNEESSKLSPNLRKTAAGACLDDVVNMVVREASETSDVKENSQYVVDENKNSILKCNETSDSLDNMCENGVDGASQTTRMDITDDDSLMNESSEDMVISERISTQETHPPVITDENGLLAFPSANDLNQRFRRLITAHQRNSKRLELELAQKARDELKKERNSKFEAARNEREERKRSQAQKWSRREESDFAKAISFFGVEFDSKLNIHDWNKFRSIGKLEKKLDETLEEYYHAFLAMCKRVTSRALTEEEEKSTINVEPIAEDRASKCLSRLEYFNKIRDSVLAHPDLDERLKLCQHQSDLPDWWQMGTHDKELLKAVAKHGLYRLDYNLAYDSELCFESIINEKVEQLFKNPPASILIPLEQLQLLLERNGIEYSKDVDLDNESDIIDEVVNSLLDTVESDDAAPSCRSTKTTRSSSGSTRPSSTTRRGANTAVKTVETGGAGRTLRLSSHGDSRSSDRRVAEVTPILPDRIPDDLRKSHEAGEVTITIISESVLLKLDDRPSMVLLGANNPITVKIRWPKDKAIQARIDNLILLVERNEWPSLSKPSLPTITLPNHLAIPSPASTPTVGPISSPSKNDKLDQPPMSPGSDISSISSRANRSDTKECISDVTPVTRGRRGRGRKPKQQPEVEASPLAEIDSPRESTAKLRNLLSQGTSSPKTSTPNDKSSSRSGGDKHGSNLSSLLASFKEKKKDERQTSSRSRDDKRNAPSAVPTNTGNLLPQILAKMKPEFRDILSNPEAASLLMNSFTNLTGMNNFGANLQTPSTSGAQSNMSFENLLNPPRSSTKSHRSERSGSRHSSGADKQNLSGNMASLLSSFKPPRSSSSSRRDDKNLLDPNQAGAANLLPQLIANMKPEFRDILANPEAASLLMSSLGGLTGATNIAGNMSGSANQSLLDSLLQSGQPSSSKGPPPAHQRADEMPANPSGRELRRNSQGGNRESSGSRSTRGKGANITMDNQEQQRSAESSSRLPSTKRRGRPSSNEDAPAGIAPGADILDLSSLPVSRKGSSLLRSEARTRRGRDQPDEAPPAASRASSSSSRSANRSGARQSQHDDQDSRNNDQSESEQGGEKRTTRASKRIGSRIDALALNLQAKRQPRSDSPEMSPSLPKEKSRDNHMAAHGSGSKPSSSEPRSKAPPAAHSGSHKSNANTPTTEHSRDRHHRDKDRHSTASTQSTSHNVQTHTSTGLPSFGNLSQEQIAQLMAKVAPPTSTASSSLPGQAGSSNHARQQQQQLQQQQQQQQHQQQQQQQQHQQQQQQLDPLAQLMSNPASLLAGLNPSALGGAGDIMNQLLRKAGTNDIVKNILNEFVKNPSLALDPNILATLTASLPMSSQSLPSFNLPTSAAASLPYGNYTNPLANPFLPFSMANLGMNNPLANPLGLFPNLYMPTRFPQPDQQQQQQQQPQHRQPNQSSGASDGSSKDKKMRYSRK